jgi:hypothetical protein
MTIAAPLPEFAKGDAAFVRRTAFRLSGLFSDVSCPPSRSVAAPLHTGSAPDPRQDHMTDHALAERLRRKTERPDRPRQVRLRFVYASYWSIAQWAFLLSLRLVLLQSIVIIIVWLWLSSSGVFASWDALIHQVTPNSKYDVGNLVTLPATIAVVAALGLVQVLGATGGAVLGCALYRWSTRVTGGVNVGLDRSIH